MAWALVLFPATAVTAAAFATNCSLIVPSPVDSSPIRSPQAVHTALAQLFVGKSLIEIGTRNGDGMFCFAKVASSAVAIEYSKPYCDELERRAHGMFKVDCNDYQATTLDADYITWWQQAPLTNERALRRIQALQKEGTVRKSAQAVVLFDLAWHKDVASMHELLSYSSWQAKIPFDERALCFVKQRAAPSGDSTETCNRASGTFVIATVPIAKWVDPGKGGTKAKHRKNRTVHGQRVPELPELPELPAPPLPLGTFYL